METKIDFVITEQDIYRNIVDAKKNDVRRLYNSLCKVNLLNIRDVCQFSKGEIRSVNRIGYKSVELLEIYLNTKGENLKEYKK